MAEYKIKQLIQVPENISAVIPFGDDDGSNLWEDAAQCGWPVLLALVEDEDGNSDVIPYAIDQFGEGELDSAIHFCPARYCKNCGQKMWIMPHHDNDELEDFEYKCPSCNDFTPER